MADWIGVGIAGAALFGLGGGAVAAASRARSDQDRLTVVTTKVKGVTNFMRLDIRYQAHDLSSGVQIAIESDAARFYDAALPRLEGGEIDRDRINRRAHHRIHGQMRHSGAPGSREFTAVVHAIWDSERAPSVKLRFEQPPGRVRYKATRRVSPIA